MNDPCHNNLIILRNNQVKNIFYKLDSGPELGKGGFGKVYLAYQNWDYSRPVAVKTFCRLSQSRIQMQNQAECIEKSTKKIDSLHTQNIVGFICFASAIKIMNKISQQFERCLIMQFCQSSLQYQIIKRRRQNELFSFQQIVFIITQITKGLQCIHNGGIIHRDIKPENILLTKGHLKVADFGIARKIKQNFHSTKIGTFYYIAPEVILQQKYEKQCDIWSIGVVLMDLINIEIIQRKKTSDKSVLAAQFKNLSKEIQKKKNLQIPKKLRQKQYKQQQIACIVAILNMTLKFKPDQRKTASELLKFLIQIPNTFPDKYFKQLKYQVQKQKQQIIDLAKKVQQRKKTQLVYGFQLFDQSKQFPLLWSITFLRDVYATIIQLKQNIILRSSTQYKCRILYLICIVSIIFEFQNQNFDNLITNQRKKCPEKYNEIKKSNLQILYFKNKCQSQHCAELISQQNNQQSNIFLTQLQTLRFKAINLKLKIKDKHVFIQQLLQKMDQSFPQYDSINEQERVIRAFRPLFAVFVKKQIIIKGKGEIILKGLRGFQNCQNCKFGAHSSNSLCRIVNFILWVQKYHISHKKSDRRLRNILKIIQRASNIIMSVK